MLPLLKVPVAVMRRLVSLTRIAGAGETVNAVRLPPVTLSSVVPLTPFRAALIEVVPCKSVFAAPPGAIVAKSAMDELHSA